MKLIYLAIIHSFILGCVFNKGTVDVNINQRKKTQSTNLSNITSVNITSDQLVLNGTNLDGISNVEVNGVAFNEAFTVESKSATQIPANANRAFSFDVTKLFDLIITDANGAATFPIQFTGQWTTSGSEISYTAGNVAIGIANPSYPLHVEIPGPIIFNNYDTAHFGFDFSGEGLTFGFNVDGAGTGISSSYVTTNGGDLQLGTVYNPGIVIQETTQRVGIGTGNPTQKLEVNGGVMLNTTDARPACTLATRGTFWFVQSGAGVKDSVEVCAKDAANAYAWRLIY